MTKIMDPVLRDKGCTWCWFSRQKKVSVESDEVLSFLSYLHCKLKGKQNAEMLKCSQEVSMIILVDIERIDYS